MSGEFIYENYGQPDGLKIKNASSRKIEKGLKRILVIAAIILCGEFVWLFGVSPCIPFSTVEVKGFPGFDGNEVLAFAGIGENASFVSVNAGDVREILGGHYLVESAQVTKRFPDRISIELEPRKAVAMSLAQVGEKQMPLYFDKEGVVFKIGAENDNSSGSPVLPVLSGLVIEQPGLGMKLPAAFVPLLGELGRIQAEAPQLIAAVSEIQIIRKPFDGFDLVLYPVHNPVRVRLGSSLNEETLRYVLLILDVFAERDSQPEEIDFRSGVSSYTVKEASLVE